MRWPWFTKSKTEPAPAEKPAEDPRAGLRINPTALAYFGRTDEPMPFEQRFKPAPKPVEIRAAAPKIAMDNACVSVAGYAQTYAYAYGGWDGQYWLGFPYLAELTQRPEYRRPAEIIAKEMTRKWIKFHTVAGADPKETKAKSKANAKKIQQIEAAFREFHVRDRFREMAELDGFFGRSHLFIDLGDGASREELKLPLARSKAKIKKGGLKRLTVVEPIWTYPNQYNSDDPLNPTFYKPQTWFVMNKEVHSSRLLTLVGRQVPDMLKPAYAFGGLSLSQIAKPYVDNWLRTRQSVSDITHSFSVSGIATNMAATLNGGGSEQLLLRAQLFNQARDNRGVMFTDKETEEFFNVSTPLTTLDKLQAQAQEQMASVVGIPLVVLLGVTPSGLNASSDGEIRTFYAWVHAQQEALFTDPITVVLEVIQLHLFGDIDPDIGFAFEPLWQLDEEKQALVRKSDADADVALIDAGVVSPEESRRRLANDPQSGYNDIDVEDVPEPPEPEVVEMPGGGGSESE